MLCIYIFLFELRLQKRGMYVKYLPLLWRVAPENYALSCDVSDKEY